jgi:hypothetical protein
VWSCGKSRFDFFLTIRTKTHVLRASSLWCHSEGVSPLETSFLELLCTLIHYYMIFILTSLLRFAGLYPLWVSCNGIKISQAVVISFTNRRSEYCSHCYCFGPKFPIKSCIEMKHDEFLPSDQLLTNRRCTLQRTRKLAVTIPTVHHWSAALLTSVRHLSEVMKLEVKQKRFCTYCQSVMIHPIKM